MPSWKKVITSGSVAALQSLTVTGGITGSLLGTSSWATNALTASFVTTAQTASYVLNAQSSSVANAVRISNSDTTATPQYIGFVGAQSGTSTLFTDIDLTYIPNTNTLNTTSSRAITSSFATNASTASYVLNAISASFASTASFVNTLNQSVLVTGSLTVGLTSTGASENTLTLGPSPAGGAGEGGQLGLNAQGGTYTSASFIDNWQNYFRILKGTNASSTGLIAQWNIHNTQMQLPGYTSPTSLPGTVSGLLAFDSSGNIITTTTGSGGGGGGVTINNNVDNYIVTATGTANTLNGESGLQYNGTSLSVTGQVTASGAITSTANGAMYFRGGDDAEFWDINVANTVGIYGQQNADRAGIKLGSSGPTLFGSASRLGIGTITPTSASLTVEGNVWATSFTGSFSGSHFGPLTGTASYATQALSASFAPVFPYTGSAQITGSLGVTGSLTAGDSTLGRIRTVQANLDWAGVKSLDWQSRALLTTTGNTSVDWQNYTLNNSGGTAVLTWGNGLTGSIFGTASWAVSASWAPTPTTVPTASFVTASNVYGPFGSNSIISASYAVTASYTLQAASASYAATASFSLATTENRILVMNKSGATITKGMVVHITGSNNSSDTPYIITASYFNDASSANTLGIASQTITVNNTGYITTEGVMTGMDVTGFSSGQLIYLGATGSIIGSAPVAPLHAVRLGQVVRDSPSNNGAIYVRIDNGYELEELHNVLDTSTTSSYGDLLVRSGSVWTNSRQLTGSYGLTGSLNVTDTLQIGTAIVDYASVNPSISGSNTIFTQATGSFTSAFMKYTVSSGSNTRAGEFMTAWNGTSTVYTDTSTTDIGNTSGVSFISSIVSSQLRVSASCTTAGWNIKTLSTFI